MPETMQPVMSPEPLVESFVELPPHSRLPRLDLGVDWESPWGEFGTSVRDFFAGPRPLKESELETPALRVDWIQGRLPGKAFLASCLWHGAAIVVLLLPIWSFLPAADHNLAPVQIESTLYFRAEDLPRISLPKPEKKAASKPRAAFDANEAAHEVPQAYHPRQTILSVPVRVTHPRQTLIQPDAPQTRPKVDPQLPNIVQWAASAPPKPQLQLSPTAARPRVQQRTTKDVAVPEVANNEKNPGPLNIAASPVINLQPQLSASAMTARAAQHQARVDSAAAPEIGGAAGDASLHRIIALSATPGPPAPEVSVPQGNLAARIAISPEGTKSGASGAAEHGAVENPLGAGANANSLPAAVSVSGGNARPALGGIRPNTLRLNPLEVSGLPPASRPGPQKGPSVIGALDPSLPPEKILSGKEVYTLDVNMPNLTSVTGSWVLYFAELDGDDAGPAKPKGRVSSPVPVEKVDPKYPPDLINEHVDGEVVLYAIIRKDGSVDSIQLVRKLDPQLDRNAVEALGRWKFRPGTRNGEPVDLEAVVHIPFRFRNPQN
jgi:TonB family protein